MERCYYADYVKTFVSKNNDEILGKLVSSSDFDSSIFQKNAWQEEINILKNELALFSDGFIAFEYTIPRVGKRIDNVFIYKNIVFLLEFKVGESKYKKNDIIQIIDYALDLKDFHKESSSLILVPILIATNAPSKENNISIDENNILTPVFCNKTNLKYNIDKITNSFNCPSNISPNRWIESQYYPTPTIIEAAQKLFLDHTVEDISRNDAHAINLSKTICSIENIIEYSKSNHKKSICFVTGVPGAGKTLLGLTISAKHQYKNKEENAVFLSGNGPLVDVLQEALAIDNSNNEKINKSASKRKVKEFIQLIHHFRDDALSTNEAPIEKVVIFDEAQRAWTQTMLSDFMKRKKGIIDFKKSEPEFLIEVMNRHKDWATIICLIGGGQEINTGEAGLMEWFSALHSSFPNWDVYLSTEIKDKEFLDKDTILNLLPNAVHVPELHLSVSLRSFRSENVSNFVKYLLDADREKAIKFYETLKEKYPIFLTRNLLTAKNWVRNQAKGSRRYGLIASSGAKRLRSFGIWVQNKIDAPKWFLNGFDDVRSSYFLEETATEFDIQGLEIDWAIVCWDADLRFQKENFEYYKFKGTKWENIKKEEKINYLKNSYRVLLTRSREGFIIFIPEGSPSDETRKPSYYNGIYDYLLSIGIKEI